MIVEPLRSYSNCRILKSSGILWVEILNRRARCKMSLRAYDEHEVELSTRGYAHRVSDVLGVLCALVVAWVAAGQGGLIAGAALGVTCAAALLLPRGRPGSVTLHWSSAGALRLSEGDGAARDLPPGQRTRLIGPLLLLDCRAVGLPLLWITALDLPPGCLRVLRIRLSGFGG